MINKFSKAFLTLQGILKSRFSSPKSGHGTLIVKIDAIGDFFILLNCLSRLNNSRREKKSDLTVICNDFLIDLGRHFLPFIRWIGVNKIKFEESADYRSHIYNLANDKGSFRNSVNLAHSRDWMSDLLMANTNSSEKLGAFGDCAKQGQLPRILSSLIYDYKISGNFYTEFGFIKEALVQVTGENFTHSLEKVEGDNDYIVLFPGASWFGKAWSGNSFAKIVEKVLIATDLNIYICGGEADLEFIKPIDYIFSDRVINMVAKTTLLELCEVIKKSKAIVTNDTSAAHIAQFYNIGGVAIIGGGHFGRFLPYDETDKLKIVNKEMDCYGCNWNCKFEHGTGPVPCISNITVDEVFAKLQRFL